MKQTRRLGSRHVTTLPPATLDRVTAGIDLGVVFANTLKAMHDAQKAMVQNLRG